MSKSGWITMGIVFCISAILSGLGIYQIRQATKYNQEHLYIAQEKITDECTEEGMFYGEDMEEKIATSSAEEKVSPNANLIIRKHYKQCDHTVITYAEVPENMVNKTQEKVESEYPQFVLVGFSPYEITVEKEVDGICNEHYMVKEKNGTIAIYTVDENDKETLKEETKIATEYLPEEDLEKIKNGIRIYGQEALNSLIEDFE